VLLLRGKRGYPNGTDDVLSHLMDAPENDRWMHIAQILRPNLPGGPPPVHGWTSVGWDKVPVAPRYTAKVAFMTGPGAISYAESVMGYVEALGLPIVGAATAGTNGNMQVVTLPSGRRFTLTGMKVTRHDGTRSHSLGIAPTIPAGRTIAGVTAGRDEVLERAISVVKP
jgi:Peptidase family S41